MSLSLWQCSVAWLKKYKIAEFVEKKDLLENRYQQLLIEKSKLTSYKRIKEIALSKLNMHPYTSTPYFININRDF
jgi:cell division protein FtsL